MLADRLPPQHLEAERGFLGSCLMDNSLIDSVVEDVNLRPDDLYRDAHQQAWTHILSVHNSGQPVDSLSFSESLKRAGVYYALGADEFLTELIRAVPHAANGKYYAEVVKQKAVSRSLIETANGIIERGYSNEHTGEELLALAEKEILAIGDKDIGSRSLDGDGLMDVTMADFLERRAGKFVGLGTGFMDLDQMIGGMLSGQLVVVAARPSIGKTAFSLAVGVRAAETCKNVLFVSLEMNSRELGERLLSYYSGISSTLIRNASYLAPEGYAKIVEASKYIRTLPLVIDDRAGRTVVQIAALARRTKSRRGLDLLIIDQLSLINGEHVKGENREQVVARISTGLKVLARDLGVPLVIMHQLNRQVEGRPDKKPMLSDLRESGQVEADADIVLLLHRPEFYNPDDRPGEADVFVAKNRNGATGAVPLAFLKDSMRFDSMSRQDDRPAF